MAAVNNHFSTEVRPHMSEIMGWPADKIRLFNSCQKTECFNALGADKYEDRKPWKERKGCDTLSERVTVNL
jgi:hypothetical protein